MSMTVQISILHSCSLISDLRREIESEPRFIDIRLLFPSSIEAYLKFLPL